MSLLFVFVLAYDSTNISILIHLCQLYGLNLFSVRGFYRIKIAQKYYEQAVVTLKAEWISASIDHQRSFYPFAASACKFSNCFKACMGKLRDSNSRFARNKIRHFICRVNYREAFPYVISLAITHIQGTWQELYAFFVHKTHLQSTISSSQSGKASHNQSVRDKLTFCSITAYLLVHPVLVVARQLHRAAMRLDISSH